MGKDELRLAILSALASIAPEIDTASLRDDLPLRRQVDLDSIDWLNFLIGIYEQTGIDITETDYAHLSTLEALLACLLTHQKPQGLP